MRVCLCGRLFHHGVCYNCGNTLEEAFVITITPEVFGVKKLKRKEISLSKRKKVYNRDGNKCLKCESSENLTLDHIIPWSKGGSDNINNLQTLCTTCNFEKSDKSCEDFRHRKPLKTLTC